MDKKELRRKILRDRAELSEIVRENASLQIARFLFSCPEYEAAKEVFFFASYGDEVNTWNMIDRALKGGKKVALPKIMGKRELGFYYIESMNGLQAGYRGILEPKGEEGFLTSPKEGTLVVLPGVAFDNNGGRMGYGGGYYDTYLSRYGRVDTCALAFACQIVDEVPMEEHDRGTDMIITEGGIVRWR